MSDHAVSENAIREAEKIACLACRQAKFLALGLVVPLIAYGHTCERALLRDLGR